MSFFHDLWQSIFTPGTTPTLVKATHATFALLLVTLAVMLFMTRSWHFVFLLALAAGLWLGISWFISEASKLKQQAETNHLGKGDAKQASVELSDKPSEKSASEKVKLSESKAQKVEPKVTATVKPTGRVQPRRRKV